MNALKAVTIHAAVTKEQVHSDVNNGLNKHAFNHNLRKSHAVLHNAKNHAVAVAEDSRMLVNNTCKPSNDKLLNFRFFSKIVNSLYINLISV